MPFEGRQIVQSVRDRLTKKPVSPELTRRDNEPSEDNPRDKYFLDVHDDARKFRERLASRRVNEMPQGLSEEDMRKLNTISDASKMLDFLSDDPKMTTEETARHLRGWLDVLGNKYGLKACPLEN